MIEHKWQLLITVENYDYGGMDFYHWCKKCGTVKKVPGRVDKTPLFYIPLIDGGVTPNSSECIQ